MTPLTIASWMGRLDEEGPDSLLRLPEPVNRFPDFVGYLVRRLKILCPTMGRVKTAQILARAGLHLGSTTVRRMPGNTQWPTPRHAPKLVLRAATARRPNHLWHVDLTTVPTALGFWTSWVPFALLQVWPFCWWVGIAVDHYSRRVMGYAVYCRGGAADRGHEGEDDADREPDLAEPDWGKQRRSCLLLRLLQGTFHLKCQALGNRKAFHRPRQLHFIHVPLLADLTPLGLIEGHFNR